MDRAESILLFEYAIRFLREIGMVGSVLVGVSGLLGAFAPADAFDILNCLVVILDGLVEVADGCKVHQDIILLEGSVELFCEGRVIFIFGGFAEIEADTARLVMVLFENRPLLVGEGELFDEILRLFTFVGYLFVEVVDQFILLFLDDGVGFFEHCCTDI